MNRALATRLAAIRVLTLDVDGVLTDGRVYVDDRGRETKAFFAADGLGIRMLQGAGIEVALVSGSPSLSIAHRARRLGIAHVVQGSDDKLPRWHALLELLGCPASACAHMGDDLPDLPVMRAAGAAFSVAHAPQRVRDAAVHVARTPPGLGAVREICELLLEARGARDGAMSPWDAPAKGGGARPGNRRKAARGA